MLRRGTRRSLQARSIGMFRRMFSLRTERITLITLTLFSGMLFGERGAVLMSTDQTSQGHSLQPHPGQNLHPPPLPSSPTHLLQSWNTVSGLPSTSDLVWTSSQMQGLSEPVRERHGLSTPLTQNNILSASYKKFNAVQLCDW